MRRVLYFIYGLLCYVMFFGVYLYFAGFVGNYFVPKSIDSGGQGPIAQSLLIDAGLILLFAIQHSVMARPRFKAIWTRFVPQPIERSTYVLFSNIVLIVMMWLWQPVNITIWQATSTAGVAFMTALFAMGWLAVPSVSMMISHFDLFGLRQVWLNLRGKVCESLEFRTPFAYSIVRHPLYIGWALAFWATPHMSVGHLLLAGLMTVYMIAASVVEERDLVAHFGQIYEKYLQSVPRFIPRMRKFD